MAQQAPESVLFDPGSAEFRRDPYPSYRRLRESSPIHPFGDNVWILTRYHDCVQALEDARLRTIENVCLPEETASREPEGAEGDFVRLRRATLKALSPSVIRGLQPMIQRVSDELVDVALETGKVELMDSFGCALATTVFCEIYGIPSDDRATFREWIEPVVEGFDASIGISPDVAERRDQAWAALTTYLQGLSAERRKQPQSDLISEFVRIQADGESLTDEELANVSILLLVAGHETTASLIGNAVYALLRNPAELQRLRSGAEAAWPQALEEFIRYDPPGQVIMRQAAADLYVRDTRIPQGSVVAVGLAAANRDPEVFEEPERLNVARDPNPHLGFGYGPRYCIGSRLARVEALTALQTFVTRTQSLTLAEEPTYKPTLVRRAPASLWIELR